MIHYLKRNNQLSGFWFGYIDSFVVIAIIFLVLFVSLYAESLIKSEREKQYINARDVFVSEIRQLGAQSEGSRQAGGWRISIADNILFNISSAEISPAGNTYINQIVAILKKFFEEEDIKATARIVIGGHSDTSGNNKWSEEERKRYNLRLSEIRANNVANIFQHEMPDMWMEAIGYGEKYPKKNASKRSENRRISIVIQLIAAEYLPPPSSNEMNMSFPYIPDDVWKNSSKN